MNKKYLYPAILLLVLGFAFSGCSSAPPAQSNEDAILSITQTVTAGASESVLVIQRQKSMAGSAVSMRIWIDDVEVLTGIRNGTEVQIAVPNGEHTIQAGSTNMDRGNKLTFYASRDMVLFHASPSMGVVAARFNLTERGRRGL